MYWQKRFDREDPDIEILQIIRDIREEYKDYGCRRICGELRKQGVKVKQEASASHSSEVWYAGHILHKEKQQVQDIQRCYRKDCSKQSE